MERLNKFRGYVSERREKLCLLASELDRLQMPQESKPSFDLIYRTKMRHERVKLTRENTQYNMHLFIFRNWMIWQCWRLLLKSILNWWKRKLSSFTIGQVNDFSNFCNKPRQEKIRTHRSFQFTKIIKF